MPRTDVHSPLNLVTEDYDFAYAYDAHPHEGDRAACMGILNTLIEDGWHFGQVHGGDTCDHCGARLRYVAVLKHRPTRTLIKVGETCLDNRFELATPEFHRLRKAAALNRERIAKQDKRSKFLADPRNAAAFEFCEKSVSEGNHGWEGMRHNFVFNVNRYGDASEKFVAAIERDMQRTAQREAQRLIDAANASPVVEGRITIKGTVLSVKWQENAYGGREVMTVKDERGFKVWGSVPRGLNPEKGGEVEFIATVEKSDRDETFGFFKRPKVA